MMSRGRTNINTQEGQGELEMIVSERKKTLFVKKGVITPPVFRPNNLQCSNGVCVFLFFFLSR